jgi:ribosomal protein L10
MGDHREVNERILYFAALPNSGSRFVADEGTKRIVTEYTELTQSANFILLKDRRNVTVNNRKRIWKDVYGV